MKAEVKEVIRETHDTKSFLFELDGTMNYQTSQFVMLKLGGKTSAFSIACAPNSDELLVTARIIPGGRFTPYLGKLKVGDKVELEGPHGKFIYESGKATLLGAGVGIAPLRGIMQCAVADGQEVELHYTDKTEKDLIYKKEFEALRDDRKIKLNFILTREEDSQWPNRIDLKYLRNKISSKEGNFYVCGAPEFVTQTITNLKKLGISESQIKNEKF